MSLDLSDLLWGSFFAHPLQSTVHEDICRGGRWLSPNMSTSHGCWPHGTAEQKTSAMVAREHLSSQEHQLLQSWLVPIFWAAGLSSILDALHVKPNAQGDKRANLLLGYFFAHFSKF